MRLEYVKRREEYFLNWRKYAELILKEVRKRLNDAKVVVFGSVIRGDWCLDSDIDVLIVSDSIPEDPYGRAKIVVNLKEFLGSYSPFEFHFATTEEFKNWYMKFIDVYVEVGEAT